MEDENSYFPVQIKFFSVGIIQIFLADYRTLIVDRQIFIFVFSHRFNDVEAKFVKYVEMNFNISCIIWSTKYGASAFIVARPRVRSLLHQNINNINNLWRLIRHNFGFSPVSV